MYFDHSNRAQVKARLMVCDRFIYNQVKVTIVSGKTTLTNKMASLSRGLGFCGCSAQFHGNEMGRSLFDAH